MFLAESERFGASFGANFFFASCPPFLLRAARGGFSRSRAMAQKVITKNSLDTLNIKLQSDVDWLVNQLVPKLKSSPAKRASYSFTSGAIQGMSFKLSQVEAEQIHKIVKDMLQKRKKAEAEEKKRQEEEEEKKKKEALPENDVPDDEFFKQFM
eukprot:s2318_g3.t1